MAALLAEAGDLDRGLAVIAELAARVERYRAVLERPATSADARIDPEGDFRRFGTIGHDLYHELLGPVAERLDEVFEAKSSLDAVVAELPLGE